MVARNKKRNYRKSPSLTWKGKELDHVSIRFIDGDENNTRSELLGRDGKRIRIAESKVRKLIDHWDNESERRDNV